MLYSFKTKMIGHYQKIVPILRRSTKFNFIATNITNLVIFGYTTDPVKDDYFKKIFGNVYDKVVIQKWEEVDEDDNKKYAQ